MTRNHTTMMGPKNFPSAPVPRLWMAKSAARMPTVAGTTYGLRPSSATPRPSMAESTEIAGVMTPSPNNSALPAMTRRLTSPIDPPGASRKRAGKSVSSAMMPPSPRLSACINSATYLTVTTSVSDQNNNETTPKMLAWLSSRWWWFRHSWKV